jgi:hypothetical protein
MPKIYGSSEILGDLLVTGSFSVIGSFSNIYTTSSSVLSLAGNVATNSSYANIRVYAAGIYNRLLSQEQIEELQSFFRKQGIL